MPPLTPEQLAALTTQANTAADAAAQAQSAIQGLTVGTQAMTQATLESHAAMAKSAQLELQLARETGASAAEIRALKAEVISANAAHGQYQAQMAASAAALEKFNNQAKQGHSSAKQLGAMVGLLGDSWENHNNTIFLTAGGLKGLGSALKEMAKPMNIAGSIVSQFIQSSIEMTMALDNTTVAMNKQTGMGDEFSSQIKASEERLRGFGVEMAQVGAAYGDLQQNLGKFTSMSDANQSSMAESVALLDKYGIAAGTSVASLGAMTDAMGYSGKEAMNMQKSLFMFATENHVSTGKMMADWAASADQMADFGDQGVEVFGQLAVAADKSNMAVADLLNLAAKFDTFEGATESVGKLNALLGGPFLNSLEMVMTTNPTERLSMLQGAINATGQSFQDMSYYEKKAIADAAGLQSTADLASLMKGEFDALSGGIGKTEEELEALEEKNASFNTLMEEVRQTMKGFAVAFEPVVKWFKKGLEYIQNLDPEMKKTIVKVAMLAVGLKLLGELMSGPAADGQEAQQQATEQTSKSLGVYIGALGKAVALILVAIPAFKVLSYLAGKVADAFANAGNMTSMFESMNKMSLINFGAVTLGLKGVVAQVNALDPEKAIAIKTVFDSAAPQAVTQAINTTTQASANASAQTGATGAQQLVAAPIQITSIVELDKRELGKAIADSEVSMKILSAAASGANI